MNTETTNLIIPLDAVGEGERIQRIPLNLLRPNPYQPRASLDPAATADLAADLRRSTLLHPIVVRKKGEVFEIGAGHRRTAAFQQLFDTLPPGEREQYGAIPAVVRDLSDVQMAQIPLTENLNRRDLTLVDEAEQVDRIWQMTTPKPSLEELAKQLNLRLPRVYRLERLQGAPEFIKRFCGEGLDVEVPHGDGEEPEKESRKLELFPALEFLLVYQHYRASMPEEEAERRTVKVIEKALRDGWGLRKIEALRRSVQKGDEPKVAVEPPEADDGPDLQRWGAAFLLDAILTKVRSLGVLGWVVAAIRWLGGLVAKVVSHSKLQRKGAVKARQLVKEDASIQPENEPTSSRKGPTAGVAGRLGIPPGVRERQVQTG